MRKFALVIALALGVSCVGVAATPAQAGVAVCVNGFCGWGHGYGWGYQPYPYYGRYYWGGPRYYGPRYYYRGYGHRRGYRYNY
jgi:hypothetical protein